LGNLYKRLEPVVKTAFHEALTSQAGNIQDDPQPLELLLNRLQDYVPLSAEHCVFDIIRKQFFRRIFKFLAASLLDALVQEGSSYGQGIQVKMILTKLGEWARHKVGAEIGSVVEEELEVARQAANVLCLFQKSDLAKEEFRETVCPHLRPAHVLHLLQGYRPDLYDKEPIPSGLLDQLKHQDEVFQPNVLTFNPKDQPSLKFESEGLPFLDLENIKLPKVVLDRPGFAFLNRTSRFTTSNNDETHGKW